MNKAAAKQEMNVLNEKWLLLNEQAQVLSAKIKSSLPEIDIEADRNTLDAIYDKMESLHKARVQVAREAGFYVRVMGNRVEIYTDETELNEKIKTALQSDGIRYL